MIAALLAAAAATLVVGLLSLFGFKWSDDSYSFGGQAVGVVSIIGFIVTLVLASALALSSFNLLGAPTRAQIINQEFGTNYTARDVFFAEGLIEEVQQVKRKRIEIQGEKKDEVGVAVPAE